MYIQYIFSLFMMCLFSSLSFALPTGFHQKDLLTGLDAVGACVLPDGRIIAYEKFGLVTLVKNGAKQNVPFLNWENNTNSRFEKGMLSIIPDPNFLKNNFIYVWYCDKRQGANGQDRVSRFILVWKNAQTQSAVKIALP